MKFIKYLIVIGLSALILWIDLPRAIPIRFAISQYKVNTQINPLVIDFTIAGTRYVKRFETLLGLDLRGGSNLVFEADTTKLKSEDLEDALNSARDIIERRVNGFGVSEPSIKTIKSGNTYRISVDLPGVDDAAKAVSLIGQTAQLYFKELEGPIDPKTASMTPLFLLLTKESQLNGSHIEKAVVGFNQENGQPEVNLKFNKEGTKLFGDITKRNVGQPVGIFIDEYLVSAPTVRQEITTGAAVISGNFTIEQSRELAIAINSGALPVPIKLVQKQNIGATLGQKEVERSITAGVIGLLIVMIFMVAYYGRLGIIACMGLIIYGLISWAAFRAIPIVLTLPGVAGFLLSIGMAVDSNILIFERIKEEQRKGKSFDSAVRLGFGRAVDAIKDANITTLLVAFILFNPLNWEFFPQFGLVRGFALTLAVGVAISLFTGLVITRRLITIFYRRK